MPINPHRSSLKLLTNTLGQTQGIYSDTNIVSLYRVRLFESYVFGPTIQIYTLGCPYRCAMCWVHNDALGAQGNGFVAEKIAQLPKGLRSKSLGARYQSNRKDLSHALLESSTPQAAQRILDTIARDPTNPMHEGQYFSDDIYEYISQRVARRYASQGRKPMVVHSGGSPTLYRGYLDSFSRRAQEDRIKVGVVTEGFSIAHDSHYLDSFAGLEDTLHWLVTVKNATPKTFTQLTGVKKEYSLSHFTAMQHLVESGFPTAPILVVDMFASKDELDLPSPKNPVHQLHESLSFHPQFPALLSLDKAYFGAYVDDGKAQRKKLNARGYKKNHPGLVEQRIREYFTLRETPIRKFSVASPVMKAARKLVKGN